MEDTMSSQRLIGGSKLRQLSAKWLKLYRELYADDRLQPRLAAPFLSVPPPGYNRASGFSILLVGRATRGQWCGTTGPQATVATTRDATRSFLKLDCSTPFWRFAQDLSVGIAGICGDEPCNNLRNLVWTNICKLGEIQRNPRGKVFDRQRELAIETLRAEIETYRPNLIVFVSGEWGDQWVEEVVGETKKEPWRDATTYWWREAGGKRPAMLWTKNHPQGRSRQVIKGWLRKAEMLAVGAKGRPRSRGGAL